MKKILLFVLGCTIACSSAYAMDNSNKTPKNLLEVFFPIEDATKAVNTLDNPSKAPIKQKLTFTRHALERMKERDITRSQIKDAIKFGLAFPVATKHNCYKYTYQISKKTVAARKENLFNKKMNIQKPKGIYLIQVIAEKKAKNKFIVITVYVKKIPKEQSEAFIEDLEQAKKQEAKDAKMNALAKATKKAARDATMKALAEKQAAMEDLAKKAAKNAKIKALAETKEPAINAPAGKEKAKWKIKEKIMSVAETKAPENTKETATKAIAEQKEKIEIEPFKQKCVEKTNSFEKRINQKDHLFFITTEVVFVAFAVVMKALISCLS